MRLVRRPAALMAATCLAISGLSACGGDADGEGSSSTTVSPLPGDSTTSSSSSSTSSTSSSSTSTKGGDAAPALPAAAKKHTKDGAVAFAEWYWGQSGVALETGSTEAMKSASTGCVPCDKFVSLVNQDTNKGLRAAKNPITITTSAAAETADGKSDEAVKLTVKQAKYDLVDSKGTAQSSARAADYNLIVYVDWEDGKWTVIDMYQILT